MNLPKELEERFTALAKMKGTHKNSFILTVLEEWLEDQEDSVMADKSIAALFFYRNGNCFDL